MNQKKTQKVFIQYTYCPLCRTNHKKGKKHVLTTRHQEIVSNIIKKIARKIAGARKAIDNPVVKELNWTDAGRKFWCYFCQDDVDYHKVNSTDMGDYVAEHGGMLEHIVREDHIDSTKTFLKNNRVDMKRTSEFVLTNQEYIKFLESLEKAVSLFFRNKAHALQRMSSQIRVQSALRRQIVSSALVEQSNGLQDKQSQKQVPDLRQTGSRPALGEDLQWKKTAQAFGQGLTVIDRSKEDDTLGNMYTNAVPPWLTPDAEDTKDTGQIGPTMSDLEKHRKLEKKAKLPATRVGAKYDRSTDQSDTWMPSFGGVWHHARRTDSVKQFQRRGLGKQRLSWAETSYHSSLQTSSSVQRKVQMSHTLFSDKSSVELGSTEGYLPTKIPKTTATAPAPWNRYITATAQTSLSSSLDSLSTSKLEHELNMPHQRYDQHLPQSFRGSDTEVHEALSFDAQIKPYVSKRKRQAVAANLDSLSNLDHASHPFNSFHDEQYHQPYNNHHSFGHSLNPAMHHIPYHHPNGYPVSRTVPQPYPTGDQYSSSFNLPAPPGPAGSKGLPVRPVSGGSQQLPHPILTPLLQKQNKKYS